MFQITVNGIVYDLEFTRFEEYSFVEFHTNVIAKNGESFYHRFGSETSLYEIIEWLDHDSRSLPFHVGDIVEIVTLHGICNAYAKADRDLWMTRNTQGKITQILPPDPLHDLIYRVGNFLYRTDELKLIKRD